VSDSGSGVLALTIAYDGAGFSGFALQPRDRTVQGTLEDALETVLRRRVETVCAGRTDAGVHALGQVVSFNAHGDEPKSALFSRSLNGLLRPTISVREVRHAHEGFSARYDATLREYRYRIFNGPELPIFSRHVSWWVKKELDIDAMRIGAEAVTGEHEFRSFCVAGSAEGARTVRTVDSIDFYAEEICGEETLVVRVVGKAFLHSMVRIIVGTLVEVGQGRRSTAWVTDARDAEERPAAGQTAPAHGLTLWGVQYPKDCWSDIP